MHIACRLHVAKDIFLQLGHWLQWIGHVLVLLDIANDFGCLRALGKVDKVRAFDQRGNTIFDECQVGEIYTLSMC